MDPVLMVGAWAGAILAVVAAANVMYRAFLKAVRVSVSSEFDRVWKELDEQERWLFQRMNDIALQIRELAVKVDRLEGLLGERV
jgi:hypothetical protein